MNTKQKMLKMGFIFFILGLVIFSATLIVQWKNEQDKKIDPPKVEKPTEVPDIAPTLDPSLSNEEKAIQIIVNHKKLKKKDLKYIEMTPEGLYRIKNIKDTTKNEKIHYLVNLKTEAFQTVMTISHGAE